MKTIQKQSCFKKNFLSLNRRATLAFLAVFALGLAISPAAVATPTLDQTCIGAPNVFTEISDLTRAQTFTVGLSGQLTEVDVLLRLYEQSGSIQFDIVLGFSSGTQLSALGAPLASQTLSWSTAGEGFFAVDFSSAGLFVTAGEVLAIVQRPTSSFLGWWEGFNTNPYPGGEALTTTTTNSQLFTPDYLGTSLSVDLGFKTFVDTAATPEPVPEPATMLLLGSGLLGLAGYGRKKFFKK